MFEYQNNKMFDEYKIVGQVGKTFKSGYQVVDLDNVELIKDSKYLSLRIKDKGDDKFTVLITFKYYEKYPNGKKYVTSTSSCNSFNYGEDSNIFRGILKACDETINREKDDKGVYLYNFKRAVNMFATRDLREYTK